MIEVPYKLESDDEGILPCYGSKGAAGIDLQAYLPKEKKIVLYSGSPSILIPTGLYVDMTAHPGLFAAIYPRSGLGHKQGLVLGNGVGIIDNDYQGQIMISALNRGTWEIHIEHGMRIAQLVFQRYERVELSRMIEFEGKSERGAGGFGSTGV